ncbi:5-oxoprolinase/urea amidolyase family protein [Kocuria palustris]|uniref:5-oxoprolinase subunit B/C family protein n=1 Tax=Kocuria palustris TaxID=71999 RepID=UPI0024687F72|nr:5-oxoprolinase/urea amidolyase family protein [Kocuria palustris]MDH5150661.1 5-oxoprolinase/urea amidolyase family protein [Kocuria palustris]
MSESRASSEVPQRRLLPVADHSLLIECPDLADAVAVHAALSEQGFRGVGGASTVLIRTSNRPALEAALARIPRGSLADQPGREIALDVVYDGEDLHELAESLGVSADGLIEWHSAEPWIAAFAGFTPGFLYCARSLESVDGLELPEALHGTPEIPRRSSPRTAVPAGSVALAGQFSAVYPRSSPGGWQLLGRTTTPMVDLTQDPPALLAPGDRLTYRAVREAVEIQPAADPEPIEVAPGHYLVVETAGLQALIQDRGRPGRADVGISSSGALDRSAADRAARLVGNMPGTACLESVLGGLSLRAAGDQVLAVTGAAVELEVVSTESTEDGWRPRTGLPFALKDGQTLRVGAPSDGLRVYVAVRGGIDVPAVIGSRATDTLAGLGPTALSDGDRLAVGRDPGTAVDWPLEVAGAPVDEKTSPSGPLEVRVVLGPRDDWFTPEALESFQEQEWVVAAASDRVGARLEGQELARSIERELPSEGTVPGSIQVPASGLPVVFLRDHPVTGGYPVIACVLEADLDLMAQAAPGRTVRFIAVEPGSTATTDSVAAPAAENH